MLNQLSCLYNMLKIKNSCTHPRICLLQIFSEKYSLLSIKTATVNLMRYKRLLRGRDQMQTNISLYSVNELAKYKETNTQKQWKVD